MRTTIPLTAVIEDALRKTLVRHRAPKTLGPRPVHLPTFGGNGLQPGVNLDDSATLLDLMERPGDSH